MDRDPRARMLGVQTPDSARQQAGGERRLASDAQRADSQFPYLVGGMAKLLKPDVGPFDLPRKGLPLLRRRRAPMPAREQGEPEFRFEPRNCAADARLADAEGGRRSGHSAVTQHGAEQVQVNRVDHSQSAWKHSNEAFDGMDDW